MTKTRVEAFTDAVIAIVMTIMVLELVPPEMPTLSALLDMKTQFAVYLISFITLSIYWINHHHLFQITKQISGTVLWINMLLILCLSFIPFTTAFVDTHLFDRVPEVLYGVVMLIADIIWLFLAKSLIKENGKGSKIAEAITGSKKSYISIGVIVLGLIIGFFFPISIIISCLISLIPWVIPDKRIEKLLKEL
jgi:uncharacterized membrane protein